MTNNNTNKIEFQLTAFQLKVIAMIAMLCDHAAKTISFGFDVNWFLYIGRIAYPIFAFQLVEGYFKTKDFKKYCKRLLIFAIISEIPYNFIAGLSSIINPFSQNVLWTMLIGLLVLKIIDKILFQNLNFFIKTLGVVFIIIAGYLVATFAMVDYSGPGILTFVLFALDLYVASIPYFILSTFVTSLAFLCIVQALVIWLGDPGRFVAILILILQFII